MSARKSRFTGLFEAQEQPTTPPEVATLPSAAETPASVVVAERPKKEALGGKRNNPDYVQRTAYITQKTDRAVKKKLIDIGNKEFSELVEELLAEWLER